MSPHALLRTRAFWVWVLLVLATVASWACGHQYTSESAAVAVLVIAVLKIRLVGLDFMELRPAPVVLRALFEGYCLVLCAVLVGIYLWA